MFNLVSKYTPSGDQPQAIKKLVEGINEGKKERRLSPRECALIQTFPPDFPFVFYKPYMKKYSVSPSNAYKVIGNAVPPMLAFNLAKRIEEVWPLYFGE